MTLSLITNHNITNIDDIIHLKGITNEDIELAQELGLIDSTKDDFELMVDYEEEYLLDQEEEYNKSVDELEISQHSGLFECETIYNNYIYNNIPIRVNIKKNNYGFGSIDGINNVYIPKSLLDRVSVNELVSADLIYKKYGDNDWKVIKINDKKKYEPVLIYESIITYDDNIHIENTYHIPHQDIGKMIGKNGNILKKIMKDYFINNKDQLIYFNPEPIDWYKFDEWYDNANIPSLDINNYNTDYTEITLYYEINEDFKEQMKFEPVRDFIMKLYY